MTQDKTQQHVDLRNARAAGIVAPHLRDLETLAGQLAGWLAPRLPGATDITISELSYPRGAGLSHETILFDAHWSAGGSRQSQGLVVRLNPSAHMVFPDDLFDKEYRLMRLLHDGGYAPVAEPLWFEADPTLLGAPFFVMKKLQGRVAISRPLYSQVGWIAEATPAQRAKLWENGVRRFAELQKVPLHELDFLAGQGAARDGLAQEWDKFDRYIRWISQDQRWPVLEAAAAQLQRRWPKNQPPGLVWGDARLGNMMFNDAFEVVAIMDWEQPSLGGALHDLTWWLHLSNIMHSTGSGHPHLAGMGTREETIALWHEVTGISTDDIDWYEDFTALKIACLSVKTADVLGVPLPNHADLAQRLGLPLAA